MQQKGGCFVMKRRLFQQGFAERMMVLSIKVNGCVR